MKLSFDKEKLSDLMQGTVDIGKKAAIGAKDGVKKIVEKSKADSLARKIKKLNPLFPDQYKSENFNIPNVIMIVDDAVRRDIELCEGAIGWLTKDPGVEVLCLYDEAVTFTGIQFVPTVTCDAIYCVDSFDRNRFIRADCVFSKAHEERMAELKNIAYCLGAKRCTIDIREEIADRQSQSKNVAIVNGNSTESIEQQFSRSGKYGSAGHIEIEFRGHKRPSQPELKWFAHDDSIRRLIDMCCEGNRAIKTETLELSGSSSATMSQKTACSIDNAIGKLGSFNGTFSMNAEAAKEHHSKLFFHIEF